MCGITGFVDYSNTSDLEQLRHMSMSLRHRGPDDEGNEIYQIQAATVGFGFRRLSIIDLSSQGHQPMHSEDERFCIIFNGEVYNYREIREDLIKLGYKFHSGTDTEVILKSFIEWGESSVDKFIGMYAFTIFDKKGQILYLFRDRAGVKPLFYYWNNNLFLFSSELKSFHRHPDFRKELNHEGVSLYFMHGYVPAPYTIFQNTFKLLPGSFLKFDLQKKEFEIKKYWDISTWYNAEKINLSFQEASDELEEILKSAFQYRMIADVPVGVFLSGGYDSSAVTSILQKNIAAKLKTFTIGFYEDKFNEATHAKKVAEFLGTDHTEYYCTNKEAMDIIPLLPEIYDEPFADSSAIPTYLVSKIAREKVTVALSADGGDELFGGYTKYHKFIKYYKMKQIIPEYLGNSLSPFLSFFDKLWRSDLSNPSRLEKLQKFSSIKGIIDAFNIVTQDLTEGELNRLLKLKINLPATAFNEECLLNEKNDILSRMLFTDFKTFLVDDVLQKVDRATMAVSLEGREPFLDHRIAEFAARLPSHYKVANGKGKVILKHLVHKYLPQEIVNRPKMGFQVPIHEWFKKDLKHLLLEYVNEEKLKGQEIFNIREVNQLLKNYFENKPVIFHRIWKILVFQQWYYRWYKS